MDIAAVTLTPVRPARNIRVRDGLSVAGAGVEAFGCDAGSVTTPLILTKARDMFLPFPGASYMYRPIIVGKWKRNDLA